MAANRVGALYYEVMLNPRGFSEGANVVVSQQRMLKKAAKDTITPHEALQAELHQYLQLAKQIDDADPYEGQKESLQIVLNKVDQLIAKQEELKKKQYDEETAARVEELTQERLDAEEELTKEAEKQNEIQQRYLAIARARQEREDKRIAEEKQAQKEREEAARQAEKDAKEQEIAEKKRIDEMVKNFYYLQKVKKNSLKLEQDQIKEAEDQQKRNHDAAVARSLERLKNFRQYGLSIDGLSRAFADVKLQVTEVNGGLSKMAGNLAQAAGMTPAMQGLARVLGSIGLKAVGIGASIVAMTKAFSAATNAASQMRTSLIGLQRRLGGSRPMALQLRSELRQLAISAGVSAENMDELGKKLLTMGVLVSDVTDVAKTFAILSEGDVQTMQSLSKAYTDTLAKTRLMGQEALQFANAGINIYQRIADIMGVSVPRAKELIEEGKVHAEIVLKALERQAELVGGESALKENMEDIGNIWKSIKQNASDIAAVFGEPMRVTMVKLMQPMAEVMDKLAATALFISKFLPQGASILQTLPPYIDFLNYQNLTPEVPEKKPDRFGNIDPQTLPAQWLLDWFTDYNEQLVINQQKEAERAKTIEATNNQLEEQRLKEKEISDFYESQMQTLNDQFLTKEQLRDIEFERMLTEKELTEDQKENLRTRYEQLKAHERSLELAEKEKKAEEDRQKALKKQLDQELEQIKRGRDAVQKQMEADAKAEEKEAEERMRRKQSDMAAAIGMAGASFGAGTREEYQFLRQRDLEGRKDAENKKFQDSLIKEVALINTNLKNQVDQLKKQTDKQASDAVTSFEGQGGIL